MSTRHETALGGRRRLAARLEPFDSFWQAPDDVEAGYASFARYYAANYLPHLPRDRSASILVVSCGPGYLLDVLRERGYTDVLGIDSDPGKTAHAARRGLSCRAERAFDFLASRTERFDLIVAEQELNHLTIEEQLEFLRLCRRRLVEGGEIFVYGLNGANPFVGAENLAHNIDHFNTFTEHSLRQILELAGFEDVRTLPLRVYVFWRNPLNYVGLAATAVLELLLRAVYKLYGKNVTLLTKKIAATAREPRGPGAQR